MMFKKVLLPLLYLFFPSLLCAQTPSTSVIPYSGTLFSQGKPVSQSAPVQMAFALYSDTTGLDAGQTDVAPAANRVWSSWGEAGETVGSTIPVQVRNGRFLVQLGDTQQGQEAVSHPLFTSGQLYVVTWVTHSGENTFRLPPQALGTVPYSVKAHNGVPPGSVQAYMGSTLPSGWLWCDGQSYATADYPHLAAAMGVTGSSFSVPDVRGRFLRGLNDMDGAGSSPAASAGDSRDQDSARAAGSFQQQAFKAHSHNKGSLGGTTNTDSHSHYIPIDANGSTIWGLNQADRGNYTGSHTRTTSSDSHNHTLNISGNTSTSGGAETRPNNVAVRYIIKY